MSNRLALLQGEDVLSTLLSRQREAARLLSLGTTNIEVADALGYHKAYIPLLKKNIAPAIEVYNRRRDRVVEDINRSVEKGAKDGLSFMLKILEPDTKEHERASDSLKVKVAQDLLDREGSAPRVSTQRGSQKHLHMHVTPDDIQKLKDAKAGKLRERYAKSTTAEAQLTDIEASNIS